MLIRNRPPLGPCSRPMPRAVWWSKAQGSAQGVVLVLWYKSVNLLFILVIMKDKLTDFYGN